MTSRILLIFATFCLLCSCSREQENGSDRLFSMETVDGCTVVTLTDPWNSARIRDTWVFVPKGIEVPDGLPKGTVIRTPVERAVVYTSVHASLIEQIGAVDCIFGVCEPQYLTNKNVRKLVADGTIRNLGMSTSPDSEAIIESEVEVIIATPFENSGYGNVEKLGIPIFEAADYMEDTPLDRASWIEIFGIMFGKESEADSILQATVANYLELKNLASSTETRPTVLLERKYGATWGVPGSGSYIATMHNDAGASYIFKELPGSNSRQMTFEEVYDRAVDADFWLMKDNSTNGALTYDRLAEEYEPYANFNAFKEKRIYECNTVGSPYYDDIAIHPDWILMDFIKIYHPELLPDYELRYYRPLSE